MFSSNEVLHKTPRYNIDRKEFIANLVAEFHTTTNIEAKEQITANLANFAYDPINFKFLRDSRAVHLFFQLLSSPNERLVLHGVAGICNICLDSISRQEITKPENLKTIFKVFQTSTNTETLINLLTIFYLLVFDDTSLKSNVCISENLQKIYLFTKSSKKRIKSLATIFFKDFATFEKEIND